MRIAALLAGPGFNDSLTGRLGGLRVPAEIRIRAQRLVEWSVHGVDVRAALRSSSIRVARSYLKRLPYLDITMRLQAPGSPVRVPMPPEERRADAPYGSRRFDPEACGTDAEVIENTPVRDP
jgi:hypothetical protein